MATGFLGRVFRLGRNLLTGGLGGGTGSAPPAAVRRIGSTVTVEAVSRVQMTSRATPYVTSTSPAEGYVETATRTTR